MNQSLDELSTFCMLFFDLESIPAEFDIVNSKLMVLSVGDRRSHVRFGMTQNELKVICMDLANKHIEGDV